MTESLDVQVWVDVVGPWCYLGKRRLEAAVHAFEHPAAVSVRYRSYELDPGHLPGSSRLSNATAGSGRGTAETDTDADTDTDTGPEPVERQEGRRRLAAMAAKDGLQLDLDSVVPAGSFDAHRLIQLALASGGPAEQSAVLERFFSAHFAEGRSLDDRGTLQRLAAEAGLDERRVAAVLAADDYADDVRADEARAAGLGIRGVPHLVVDEGLALSGAQPVETMLGLLRRAWAAKG